LIRRILASISAVLGPRNYDLDDTSTDGSIYADDGTCFQIRNDDEELIRIKSDGTIILAAHMRVEEAAVAFWDAVDQERNQRAGNVKTASIEGWEFMLREDGVVQVSRLAEYAAGGYLANCVMISETPNYVPGSIFDFERDNRPDIEPILPLAQIDPDVGV
jgi:hypothetical protein